MKKINIYILTLFLLLSSVSCKKYIEGYEKDPNSFDKTTSEQQMLALMLSNQFFHKADGMRLAMMWVNQASGADRQYATLNDWNNATPKDFESPWDELYYTIGGAVYLEELANQEKNQVLRGLAKLYKAWAGGEAASLWGDVPFSEAGNVKIENPTYDSQQEVFDAAQLLLDEAIDDLKSREGVIPAKQDIYFSGQKSKWIKIAYGLKARLYLHEGKYQEALEAASHGPSSVDDDLNAKFNSSEDATWGQYNPMKQLQLSRPGDYNAASIYASRLLSASSEYSRYNSKTNDKSRKDYNYSGNDFNTTLKETQDRKKQGKFFGDMPLLTYAEMLLIQTEATLRDTSKTLDDALTYYNQYRQLLAQGEYMGGYEPETYDDYVATDFDPGEIENKDGNLTPREAFMREVFEERYVFFIGDYEAFIDFERSFNDDEVPEYMKLPYDRDGNPRYANQPLRFIYPQTSKDVNDNFPGMKDITEPLPLYQ